jgi:predicted RNase H-like nuclease (RuvC/YqgF family)
VADEKAKSQVEAISRNHKHEVAITKAATDAHITNLNKDIEHRNQVIESLRSELASVKMQLTNALTAQTELAKSTVDNAKAKEAYNEAMNTAAGMSSGSNGKGARG